MARRRSSLFGVALLVSLVESAVVLHVWVTCDIGGINATVSLLSVVLFGFPALLVAHLVVLGLVRWVAGRKRRRSLGVLLVQTLLVLAGAFVVLTVVATPDEPSRTCADGVPAWWPEWLPHQSHGA
ncbi:MAG: hypothetical protein ACRDO1_05560 [Nocardioidaceae bacterium]